MSSFIPQGITDFLSAFAISSKIYDLLNILITSIVLIFAIIISSKPLILKNDTGDDVLHKFKIRNSLSMFLQVIMIITIITINGAFLLELVNSSNWMTMWIFSYLIRYILTIVVVIINIISFSKGKSVLVN